LSKRLPELYQKSQELQGNVNALSQRLESLEGYLSNLSKDIVEIAKMTSREGVNYYVCGVFAIISLVSLVTCYQFIFKFN